MQAAIPALLPLTVVAGSCARMENAQLRARHQVHAQWIPTAVPVTIAAPTATALSVLPASTSTAHAPTAANAARITIAETASACLRARHLVYVHPTQNVVAATNALMATAALHAATPQFHAQTARNAAQATTATMTTHAIQRHAPQAEEAA